MEPALRQLPALLTITTRLASASQGLSVYRSWQGHGSEVDKVEKLRQEGRLPH
ncbi:hypothetical protein DXG01_010542, partial [Tephrocybe rancida]